MTRHYPLWTIFRDRLLHFLDFWVDYRLFAHGERVGLGGRWPLCGWLTRWWGTHLGPYQCYCGRCARLSDPGDE